MVIQNEMTPAIGGAALTAGLHLYALHIRSKARRDRDRDRSMPAE